MYPTREKAEEILSDVKARYGDYEQSKWDTNLALKEYYENKMGKDLYEAVEKDTFRPSCMTQKTQREYEIFDGK